MLTKTSFDHEATKGIAQALNTLLADVHVAWSRWHSLHWNVEGAQFFVYHAELEKLYDGANEALDDLAERVLMLGQRPVSTLAEHLQNSGLEELPARPYNDADVPALVLADLDHLIAGARKTIETAGEQNDEGTADLVIGMLRDWEKARWFWSAARG